MPNYLEYHQSLTDELHALKDRVRNLTTHRPTDGEFKEAALRTILRRHLPSSSIVGRGFIVTSSQTSTQSDLLIVDGTKPTLFRDGDLVVVTPDCVQVVIEVKTSLRPGRAMHDCVLKLAQVGEQCIECSNIVPWLGIFSYEGDCGRADDLLDSVGEAHIRTGVAVNCIAYGRDCFVRYWQRDELENADDARASESARWRAYQLNNLASAYFVGNVIDSVAGLSRDNNSFAWYPLKEGKHLHRIVERRLEQGELS